MLVTRTIAGILTDPNGTPMTGTLIELTPIDFLGDGGSLIVAGQAEKVLTNGSGAYSVDLYTKDTGSVRYQCNIGRDAFIFSLESGGTVSLDELLNEAGDTGDEIVIDGGDASSVDTDTIDGGGA